MFPKVTYFENIPTQAPERQILLRLGYNIHRTVLNDLHRRKLAEGIRRGTALCNLQGAYCRTFISEHGPDYIELETGQRFQSAQLAELLGPCPELVLLAATVGGQIGAASREAIDAGDAALGVILDAVASETADAGLDWLMRLLNQILAKSGLKLTKNRFSPGYGDLTLDNQRIIFTMLALEKLQLRLTPECLLIPEKSVLAIAGCLTH
ncbi:MAG: methionine synthase [Bacillota bacterium]|jgi:hypothetical protein